jgi:hypothetical protein
MNKEQKKRMAYRSVIQHDVDETQGGIEYTVQVSGDRVELHQTYDHNWENESGTGPDVSHETWVMSKDVFKSLLEAGQCCIEKSESFEADHQYDAALAHENDLSPEELAAECAVIHPGEPHPKASI